MGYTITGFREVNTRDALKKQKLIAIENILDDKEGLITNKYKKQLLKIKNIIQEERTRDTIIQGIDEYRRLEKYVKSIYYFKSQTKPTIQLIICNENILDCINSFDFNVCQVYYDGENIFVKDKDIFMICLEDKKAIITFEASEMQSTIEWLRTLKRAIKYTERGFFIDFSNAIKYIKKIAETNIQFVREWNLTLLNKNSLYTYTPKIYRKLQKKLSVLLLKTPKLPHFYIYNKNDKRIVFGYVRDESELFYIPYSERLNIPLMFQFGSDDEVF